MRCLTCLWVVLFCNLTNAQDPTVPSAQILARLKREQPIPAAALHSPEPDVRKTAAPPILKLKAMVMSDQDHGTALIEVDGRRLRLKLSRPTTEQASTSGSGASDSVPKVDQDGLVIQGSTYHVQSFTARSVMLSDGSQTLLVQ